MVRVIWILIGLPRVIVSSIRRAAAARLMLLLHKLGAVCLANGDYQEAGIAYEVLLRVNPNDRFTTFQILGLYEVLGKSSEMIQILEHWVRCAPSDVYARVVLSKLQAAHNEMTKAKEHLDVSVGIAPNEPEVLTASGVYYRWDGKLDESSDFLKSALKGRETPSAMLLLAENLIDGGKKGEAIDTLVRAVQLAPDIPGLYYSLARCGYYQDSFHPHLVYIRNRIGRDDLPRHVESLFHFALGESLDGLGQWDTAFDHFKTGNRLLGLSKRFSIRTMATGVDDLIKSFGLENPSGEQIGRSEIRSKSLIFILGMPRSGTTLVEQILASHPDVCAGGERNDVAAIADFLMSTSNEPYPFCIRSLDRAAIDELAKMYLARVSSLTHGVSHFVDKSLSNWSLVGLIAMLLPQAKFVNCQRSPLDTCLSCHFTYLPLISYTSDLRSLGLVYRQYKRLMSHWCSVFPGRVFELQYERIVKEPETHIRKLLEYCEIPWDDCCLRPHQTRRAVHTASASQVKSEINARSVERWKNYEKHLLPLVEALNDARYG